MAPSCKFLEQPDEIYYLCFGNILVDTDMKSIARDIFRFRKISFGMAEKSEARALRRHREKKTSCIDTVLFEISGQFIAGKTSLQFREENCER